MTVEFYRSLKDELHALNRRITSLLISSKQALPGWGHSSSFRHLLRKYIPEHMEVGRGVIVGADSCSELIEILIYSQDHSVLYQEGEMVFVESAAVKGIVSILPESADATLLDQQLNQLAQAASLVNKALKGQTSSPVGCFAGLLSYRPDVRSGTDTAEVLEYLADESWGSWVNEVCLAGGPYLSMEETLGVRGWKEQAISSADTATATFIGRLMSFLQEATRESLPALEQDLALSSELLAVTNGIAAEVPAVSRETTANLIGTIKEQNGTHNIPKKERRFRRFANKLTQDGATSSKEESGARSISTPTQPVLKEFPNVNDQDREGNTVLHRMVLEGSGAELIEILTKGLNININIKNKEGNTPLHLAALDDQIECARILLDHGADINARNYIYSTPLHLAATVDNDNAARILLDYGAEMEARNNRALTPLHRAAMCGSTRAAEVLVAFGADMEALTEKGITPMHLAAWYGHGDALQLLIDSEANLNSLDEDGNTPLHLAAFNGQVKTIKVMINNNADMSVSNNRGETYLQRINEGYRNEKVLVLED